jgi:hypothetical protein
MEPTTGIEPVNLFLTKEALYLLSYVGIFPGSSSIERKKPDYNMFVFQLRLLILNVERETRLELATSSLEG